MEEIKIRLVAVGIEGAINLGFIARLVENFDVDEFFIVSPKALIEESLEYAAKAAKRLQEAIIVDNLKAAIKDVDLSFCSTAIISRGDDILRSPIMPWEMAEIAMRRGGKVALVVGRESTGLTRKEIGLCDLLVNIPTSSKYRALNVSNATAILLYELYKIRSKGITRIDADKETIELINRYFDALVDSVILDRQKRDESKIALRRILAKSTLSREEGRILLYVLSRLCRRVEGCPDVFKVAFNR